MYRRVRLSHSDGEYVISLTPAQLELIRRVLVDLYGGSHHPDVVVIVAGEASAALRGMMDRVVDFQSRANIDVTLTLVDLRMLYSALAHAFLNRTSEEAFHNRYGFYSENVQSVGMAICDALSRTTNSTR